MVAHDQAASARLDRVPGIVGANEAFNDHRKRRLRNEPLEIGPAQRRIRVGVHILGERVRALGGGGGPLAVEIRVSKTLRQAEGVADVALASAGLGKVGGEHDGAKAGVDGAFHKAGAHRPLRVHVELEPADAGRRRSQVFDRDAGQRAEAKGDPGSRGAPISGGFTVRMCHPLDRRRRKVHGHLEPLPEDFVAQIRTVRRGQHLEAKPIPGERLAVGVERRFVLRAAGDVVVDGLGEDLPGRRLEVIELEGSAEPGRGANRRVCHAAHCGVSTPPCVTLRGEAGTEGRFSL